MNKYVTKYKLMYKPNIQLGNKLDLNWPRDMESKLE